MTDVLEARGITVSFGAVRACDHVSVNLAAGEVLGLTGPNGSGKTTLLNALNGLVDATGDLKVGGSTVKLGSPLKIRLAGALRTFQAPQNLLELTCVENVLLSSPDTTRCGLSSSVLARRSMHRHERIRTSAAVEALDRVGLLDLANEPASALTYGQQRLLELARAMAGRPLVLMLDEPSAGLNASETRSLAVLLSELRIDGISMIVIDHKIDFLDRLCDRIVVLHLGRIITEGRPGSIWRDPAVVSAYLGGPARE